MLLLLTLTLLATPASWAQVLHGSGAKDFFTTPNSKNGTVRAIRVGSGAIGQIISIQVKVGNDWDVVHGPPRGTITEFMLDNGEHITQVYGRHRVYILYLSFCTTKDRCAVFGSRKGQEFFSFAGPSEVLKGISGTTGPLGLTSIGMIWGDLPANATQ